MNGFERACWGAYNGEKKTGKNKDATLGHIVQPGPTTNCAIWPVATAALSQPSTPYFITQQTNIARRPDLEYDREMTRNNSRQNKGVDIVSLRKKRQFPTLQIQGSRRRRRR